MEVLPLAEKRKKLGEILVELGHLDEGTVLRHIHLQTLKHPKPLLGELLMSSGAIDWDQLKEALIHQGTYKLAGGGA